jgi:hypothetical protein
MQLLFYGLIALYVIVMPILFLNWYGFYQQEEDLTSAERQASRIVMVIATVLWPIVLPLSYLELMGKLKRYERRTTQPASSFTSLPEMN